MKNTQNVRFIYISTVEYCNVFVTQVLDWLHAYQKRGIIFELWQISSLKKLLLSSKLEFNETKIIRQSYEGKVRKLYLAPALYLIEFIFDTLLLIYSMMPDLIRGKVIILQIRSSYLWRPLNFIKWISRNRVRIVFDSRAAVTEEIIYSNRDNGKNIKNKIDKSSADERKMVEISDKVFCVSNVLIEYHLGKNPGADRSKFYLYPCCSDSSHFFYSPEFREQLRKQYHLEKRKVVVYSGGLKLPWHIPDKIFELFSGLYALDKSYYLILLSPDSDIADQYLVEHRIPKESALFKSIGNSEVVKYLCASDIGLLLRDDVPMNNVASPSKFAEYILTGLPVIISKNVGDFSNFVEENDLGYVFNNNFSTSNLHAIHSYLNEKGGVYSSKRIEIAELGSNRYSKGINLDDIIAQYYSLLP